jgi:uncharacterized protein YndB with AHSA1/START domain
MSKGLVAKASTTIEASKEKIWDALVNPQAVKQYMFGTDVVSTWREGSPIVWKGEWKGKPYEDKGVIQRVQPGARLAYSHYSPLGGQPDVPESYHTVTVELTADGDRTRVSLSQDNNASDEARQHAEQNWSQMLAGLKKYVEA